MIQIFDDFVTEEEAEKIREGAIEAGFKDQVAGPDNAPYDGIGEDFESDWLHERLALKMVEGLDSVPTIKPAISCFRRDKAGMTTHNVAHADTICATHAAILYLSDPRHEQGGTGFFRHMETGFIEHPEHDSDLSKHIQKQWTDEEKWAMHAWVFGSWRRLIVYPTTYYHGRFPREGHGQTDEDSRLIWITFFNLT
tara:strand:- start:381 stop:968 length:588 start_codon:yes stop_codon:yes gene_type:complete